MYSVGVLHSYGYLCDEQKAIENRSKSKAFDFAKSARLTMQALVIEMLTQPVYP